MLRSVLGGRWSELLGRASSKLRKMANELDDTGWEDLNGSTPYSVVIVDERPSSLAPHFAVQPFHSMRFVTLPTFGRMLLETRQGL